MPGFGPRTAEAIVVALADPAAAGRPAVNTATGEIMDDGEGPAVPARVATGKDARMGDPVSDLIIVTGMTGAGRSTAAKALEDLGCFVIDNLPPQLLPAVVRLVSGDRDDDTRIAVVVDVRSRGFFNDLQGAVDQLAKLGVRSQVLFLEASNDVLVRRQEAARRPHPLQGGARLLDGILRERELMRDLRGSADVLDRHVER